MESNTLIVLLNWNGAELTIDCCQSLLALVGKKHDIFIIDNYSTLKDYQYLFSELENSAILVSEFKCNHEQSKLLDEHRIEKLNVFMFENGVRIILARSALNHGFAKGCNFGALFAKTMSYNNLMLLNNDTIVESDFLENLILQKGDSDIVIPQIRYFEPNTKIWNCGGAISKFGKRTYYFANKDINLIVTPKTKFPITFATGCCMFMETNFYIASGMFTEDFFFGEEDVDYALRLQKINATVACVPDSIIYHKVGASLAGDLTKLRRKAFIHFLNRFINMRKHLGAFWFIWIFPAVVKMVLNLLKIYKLSLLQTFSFTKKVIITAFRKNKVEKEYFEKIMKHGY